MAKTRETTVYINKSAIERLVEVPDCDLVGSTITFAKPSEFHTIKAKLIIELPEKRVTITESDWSEAVAEFRKMKGHSGPSTDYLRDLLFARAEL